MPDSDKVIKGLQCIIDGTVRCESCGYAIDKHGHHSCQQECAKDAIALLKEQEAVEPKVIRTNSFGDPVHACGKCGMLITESMNYCYGCGKRIKWEGR